MICINDCLKSLFEAISAQNKLHRSAKLTTLSRLSFSRLKGISCAGICTLLLVAGFDILQDHSNCKEKAVELHDCNDCTTYKIARSGHTFGYRISRNLLHRAMHFFVGPPGSLQSLYDSLIII